MMPMTVCGEQTIHIPGSSACDECDEIRQEVEEIEEAIQNMHKQEQVTLLAIDWVDNEQTVTVLGVTDSNIVIVTPDPSSISDYSGIYCSAQGEDELTFTASGAVSADVVVNILIINGGLA